MTVRSAGLAALAAGALAACGSPSDSLIALRHEAGAICRRTNRAFGGIRAPSSDRQDGSFLRSGQIRLETQLRRLRALSAPHEVADVYRAALSALGQELDGLRSAVGAINQGEDPALAYRRLEQQIGPDLNQANNAWQALQIADCLQ
jgi:hypothetical protein